MNKANFDGDAHDAKSVSLTSAKIVPALVALTGLRLV